MTLWSQLYVSNSQNGSRFLDQGNSKRLNDPKSDSIPNFVRSCCNRLFQTSSKTNARLAKSFLKLGRIS
ncbi:hypothetical protein M0802_009522 [Mischocyttarus mexicanus]|nr:hypothetical protein M0802_009522 [Mischocyttarus mexicanus]